MSRGWGQSETGTRTGTRIFRVKVGWGWGQGRFLEESWDHREGTKEYFSCCSSHHHAY